MSKKNKKRNDQDAVPEDFRIQIDQVFKEFMNDTELNEYLFPSDLSNIQRKYIHERSRVLGLRSKSYGKGTDRAIKIWKVERLNAQLCCELTFNNSSNITLSNIANVCNRILSIPNIKNTDITIQRCKLVYGEPLIVDKPLKNDLKEFRESLPIYSLKHTILSMLQSHQVLIVSAETGSGKTTQIPQYLLEQSQETSQPVRIVCTQPRRLSTVAVAERVAHERGEPLGSTVGFQIKLESKYGPNTTLVYCTNGVLLRLLMMMKDKFDSITHVIVDEIHERDKYSDFLLICLREQLKKNPNLKVILMSASMDVDLLMDYFPGSQQITTPGRLFPITELFLDDILPMINYENAAMKRVKKQRLLEQAMENTSEPKVKCEEQIPDMSEAILECVRTGADDDFPQVLQLIVSEGVPVNYQDRATGFTALVAAAMHGKMDIIEQLLYLGADVALTTAAGVTAIDCARDYGKVEVLEFLEKYVENQVMIAQANSKPNTENLLLDYDGTVSEDDIDFDLIREIICYIHEKVDKFGGILVFLPGYDDLISCYEYLGSSSLDMNSIEIFMLHGSMQIGAQHRVFNRLYNKQKIVLSTNVAETSITIDDICYVIDSGRAKEKSYDAFSGTHSLEKTWIAKSAVKQRAGRSGRTRPGICFHIFSKIRYDSMMLNSTPEILRVPLQELCLHSKVFAPEDKSIASFLALAMQPPSSMAVQKAIQSLKLLGALDSEENLTTLGTHLLNFSVEPHLGKILIYGVIFKCLDPILTIVSCLNQKDPFILPATPSQKSLASARKKDLSENTLSDHMSFLRAFQKWQDAKVHHREFQFCQDNFVSASSMVTILQTRNQLLSQLRAEGFISVSYKEAIQEANVFSDSWPVVKAALLSGVYPHLAFLQGGKLCTRTEKKVVCHISSCIHKQLNSKAAQSCWYMYDELSKVGSFSSIKCTTLITPATVGLIGGEVTQYKPGSSEMLIDEWIGFEAPHSNFFLLRLALDKLINAKIRDPRFYFADEMQVFEAVNTILQDEETSVGLQQPRGLGQRPQFFYNRRDDSRRNPPNNSYNRLSFNQPSSSHSTYQNNRNEYRNNTQREQNWSRGGYQNRSYAGPNRYNNRRNFNQNEAPFTRDNLPSRSDFDNQPGSSQGAAGSNFPADMKYIFVRDNVTTDADLCNSIALVPETMRKVNKTFQEQKPVVLLFSPRGSTFVVGSARVVGVTPNSACTLEWLTKKKVFFGEIRDRAKVKFKLYSEGEVLDPVVGKKICEALLEIR